MLSLVIETCTERGCVAIMRDTAMLFYRELPFGYQNSNYLIPTIEQGLKDTGLAIQDLQLITVGVGPGSYTGIRVGAIVAKTLVFAHKVPLIGVCTLQAFLPFEDGAFTALIDAKIGGAYFIQGIKRGDLLEWTSPPSVLSLDQLGASLSTQLICPHVFHLKQKLDRLYPANQWIWQEKGPDPIQMTKQALAKLNTGACLVNGDLELLYMRKTQAEIDKGCKG